MIHSTHHRSLDAYAGDQSGSHELWCEMDAEYEGVAGILYAVDASLARRSRRAQLDLQTNRSARIARNGRQPDALRRPPPTSAASQLLLLLTLLRPPQLQPPWEGPTQVVEIRVV